MRSADYADLRRLKIKDLIQEEEKHNSTIVIDNLNIGNIPIMVNSKYCMLQKDKELL